MSTQFDPSLAETGVAAAIDAGIIIGGADVKTFDPPDGATAIPFVVVPKGSEVKGLQSLIVRNLPVRRAGTVHLSDAASFIAYVTTFKLPETRIFANPVDNVVTAVLDYHQPGETGEPRWGQHRAVLTLAHTEAWTRWTDQDGEKGDQLTFSEFIENNLMDIADPDGSTILSISRTLDAKKDVTFKSGVRLDNGQTQLTYVEQITATSGLAQESMPIPEKFELALIPFDGGTVKYRVTARLRYRIGPGGKLAIGFDLLRPDLVEKDARESTLKTIGESIGVQLLSGVAPPAFA